MVRQKATTGGLTERNKKRARMVQHLRVQAKKDAALARHLKWRTLLRPVTTNADPRFCGEVTIEPRQASIFTAAEASDAAFDPCDRVFFASGARITRQAKDERREGPGRKDTTRWFGAGIAYREPRADDDNNVDDFWKWEMIPLGASTEDRSTDAVITAIAQCLAIAAREMGKKKQRRVTVFTHCRPALLKIEKFRHLGPTELEFLTLRDRDKLITASQQLSNHLGVEIELRWVPRGSGVIGSWHAEAAAHEAALRFDEERKDTARDTEHGRKQGFAILRLILQAKALLVKLFSHWTPSCARTILTRAVWGLQRCIRLTM